MRLQGMLSCAGLVAVLAATTATALGHAVFVETDSTGRTRPPGGEPAPVTVPLAGEAAAPAGSGFGWREEPPGLSILAPGSAHLWERGGVSHDPSTNWAPVPVVRVSPAPGRGKTNFIPEPGVPLMILVAFALWRRRWRL